MFVLIDDSGGVRVPLGRAAWQQMASMVWQEVKDHSLSHKHNAKRVNGEGAKL